MKKQLLTLIAAAAAFAGQAQTIANDSASTGAAYINNAWYSLDNGIQKTDSASNWDIAVTTNTGMTSNASILFNPKVGKLFIADSVVSTFNNVFDTTGINSWTTGLYNQDTNWANGAFTAKKKIDMTSNPPVLDYGWASYNTTTHFLDANRTFLIRYTNGAIKKLQVSMQSGKFIIKNANLDNTGSVTDTINTTADTAYASRNFIYFSLNQHVVKNREPRTAAWDLLFTQYVSTTEAYYNSYTQTVTGVLTNTGVLAAQRQLTSPALAGTYVNYAADTFKSKINIIGWDWKNAPGPTNPSYTYNDSVVYFVKKANGDIWKIRMTNFGWSTNGTYYFSKQKLVSVSVKDAANKVVATVALAPNPSMGQDVTMVYSFDQNVAAANVIVTDIAGRTIMNQPVTTAAGLQQHNISTANLKAGIYIVNLVTEKGATSQKLIVQ